MTLIQSNLKLNERVKCVGDLMQYGKVGTVRAKRGNGQFRVEFDNPKTPDGDIHWMDLRRVKKGRE